MPLAPAVVGRLTDADLAASGRDSQSLGQVTVDVTENRATWSAVRCFFMGPSWAQSSERLPFQVDQFLGSRPSGSTRSELRRSARDTFASLKKTCRRLGVNFWAYLQDRVRGLGQIPRLADQIRQKAGGAAARKVPAALSPGADNGVV